MENRNGFQPILRWIACQNGQPVPDFDPDGPLGAAEQVVALLRPGALVKANKVKHEIIAPKLTAALSDKFWAGPKVE